MTAAAPVVSFCDLIFHHARVRPEKPAFILADRVVTYGMVAQGILRVEGRLRDLALAPGMLVGIAIGSPVRHMIVAAALFRLGHPSLSVSRIEAVLPLALPVGAFLHEASEPFRAGQRQILVGDDWFAGEQQPLPASRASGFANDGMICRVELSSGTTGQAKAVSLTVDALHKRIADHYTAIGFGVWDRLLCLIGHTSGWGFALAAHALFTGRTIAYAPTPRDALQMIPVYGIDSMATSTIQLRELVREQIRAPIPLSTLRVVQTGGSLASRSLMLDAGARICSTIINHYGSTETGPTAFASIDRLAGIEGATGYVAPWVEAEIVDDEDNKLPPNATGNLRIRSHGQAEPFPPGRPGGHAGFRNGWFYPGDIGRVTDDRLLILSGRKSETINAGGIKIAPEVIEDALRKHPAVIEAAAFGAMSDDGIEEIIVVAVSRTPVAGQQIIEWCAERDIPVTRVIFADELEKTESGKIHRDLIKRRYGG